MFVCDLFLFSHQDSAEGGGVAALACVHVRRGDFKDECIKYGEEARSGHARRWILSHFERGLS